MLPDFLNGCGGGTRTTRPSGYEPDKLPTAPLRDINCCTVNRLNTQDIVVLVTGLEPVRELPRRILSPLRLPIPPHELVLPLRCLDIVARRLTHVKHQMTISLFFL